ncbi:MAG: cytochrome c oxidase assembly protein [Dehalococcoidia bacterium]
MWTAWEFNPTVVSGMLALGLLYFLFAGPWRGRFPASVPVTPSQAGYFYSGLIVFWIVLQSPIDRVGDDFLFLLHMFQHMVIILIVPILLLKGTPGWMLEPLMRLPILSLAIRTLCRPLVAFTVFNLVFAVAHLPVFFDPVNSNEALHAIEHLVFLVTALAMWMPVLSPLPSLPTLSYPMQMGYMFLQTLPCSIVGAFIALSGDTLYQRYALAPRISVLTSLQDQQLGGLLMWVGTGMFFFGVMMVMFFLWFQQEEGKGRLPVQAAG